MRRAGVRARTGRSWSTTTGPGSGPAGPGGCCASTATRTPASSTGAGRPGSPTAARSRPGVNLNAHPGDFIARPGQMPVVEADRVLDVPVLVDARAPERYRGETEPIDPVAGHIPGAVNVPTSANLDATGRFRSPDEIKAAYEAAGVPTDGMQEVAVYCGSGVTAVHDIIALETIGVQATLYPGSWSGWITDPPDPWRQEYRVTTQTTQVLLAARPHGEPTPADFETVTVDLPPLEDGQVLLEVRYLSLDPYMRGRMSDAKSYADPVPLGGVMVGATVCQVVESRSPERAGRRLGAVVLRLADPGGRDGEAHPPARPGPGAGPDGARRARHARLHGVRRAAAAREAAAGGDRRGRRRDRPGRLRGRPDREGEGRAGGRHRRWPGQVPGPARGVRLRRRGRPPCRRLPGPARRRRAGRHRRLLRERRRRGLACGGAAPQPVRADPGLRAGRRLQRHDGAARARTGSTASCGGC